MKSGASSSATATQAVELPRIECPKCHVKVVKCKTQKKGEVYYKCPNHFPQNSICPYYWYEEKYLDYLRSNHIDLLNVNASTGEAETDATEVNGDLRLELCMLKLQLSEVKVQVGEVMRKVMEAKDKIKEEIAKSKNVSPVISCHIS